MVQQLELVESLLVLSHIGRKQILTSASGRTTADLYILRSYIGEGEGTGVEGCTKCDLAYMEKSVVGTRVQADHFEPCRGYEQPIIRRASIARHRCYAEDRVVEMAGVGEHGDRASLQLLDTTNGLA